MTRLMFGVCASLFAANMALRKNAMTAQAALESFYVDDGLTGAYSVRDAVK